MTQSPKSKKGNFVKTVVLGAVSIGMYTALFANEAAVTEYYTRGNYYAVLPIATAFLFSFVHGGFASNLLETLGLTARKTTSAGVTAQKQKQPAAQKDNRPRLEIS